MKSAERSLISEKDSKSETSFRLIPSRSDLFRHHMIFTRATFGVHSSVLPSEKYTTLRWVHAPHAQIYAQRGDRRLALEWL